MIELRVGPWRALLDGPELRNIRCHGTEVIHHLYVAVRTPTWSTVLPEVRRVVVEAGDGEDPEGLEILVEADVVGEGIELDWTARYRLRADGSLGVSLEACAGCDFAYNRIGICILHPWRVVAGAAYQGHGPAGEVEGTLSETIQPQLAIDGVLYAVHPPVDRLTLYYLDGGSAAFSFEGDLFETEDQRNWSDASFKTYSTPLAAPRPRHLATGAGISQAITCRVAGVPHRHRPPDVVTLEVGDRLGTVVPDVGTALPSSGRVPSEATAALTLLAPAHLRLDVTVGTPGWLDALEAAAASCRELGCLLELALHVDPRDGEEVSLLAGALAAAPLARVLVVAAGGASATEGETTPPELIALLRPRLPAGVPLAAGSAIGFCELNRRWPPLEGVDGIFWAVNPQVHAFDDQSVLETPEVQGEQARSAHALAPGRELHVGPVTFLQNRVLGRRDLAPGEAADARQASLLGAAWTAASCKYLAESGASSVTYFECAGWRGLVHGSADPPLPGAPPPIPGRPLPLLHVLTSVAASRGNPVLSCHSDDSASVVGLAVEGPRGCELLVANLTPRRRSVRLAGPGLAGPLLARRLDSAGAARFTLDPAGFVASPAEALGSATVELRPYETLLATGSGTQPG